MRPWQSRFAGLILVNLCSYRLSDIFQKLGTRDIAFYERTKERALSGDGAAELQVGLLLSEGRGVVKNDKEAALWFKKGAQHGNVEAEYHYGNALFKGVGVLQNYKDAIYWIEKSARSGYVKAQYDLGNIYRFKTGV